MVWKKQEKQANSQRDNKDCLERIKSAGYDINIEAKEIVRVRKRINNIISNATGQPLEKVEKDTDRNYWLNAEEAVDYGIVNKIITSYDELPNL